MPAVFAGADAVLDPGVHPVGGVDVGGLAAPAAHGGGQVGDPQAVPPAVCGLEQGQLGAGVRAARGGRRPACWRASPPAGPRPGPRAAAPVSSVTCASSIQHRAVRAAAVGAGVIGAALADLAAVIDGDLPGLLRGRR